MMLPSIGLKECDDTDEDKDKFEKWEKGADVGRVKFKIN